VRRIVRPFIKEFKNRLIKPSSAQPRPSGDAANHGPKPSFTDPSGFATRRINYADGYKAALEAADAVFGGRSSAVSIPETAPSSNAPVGRILPSLIDEDVALAGRSTETDEKLRRGCGLGKGQSSPAIRRNKPTLQAKSEAARVAVACVSPEKLLVSAPRLQRRSIQKRWVLETELKAGEKWKRRLRQAAR
jgi:hypothetical protein